MFRKIPAVNYKTKEVKEIEISLLETCAAPGGCEEKPFGAIIFDEPYGTGDASVQGEVLFCETHMNDLMQGTKKSH
jgi:hypothetical protein